MSEQKSEKEFRVQFAPTAYGIQDGSTIDNTVKDKNVAYLAIEGVPIIEDSKQTRGLGRASKNKSAVIDLDKLKKTLLPHGITDLSTLSERHSPLRTTRSPSTW